MSKFKILGVLFLGIFLIVGVFASYELGSEPSFSDSYVTGGKITGWANMSFSNELLTKKFSDNFENSITLIDLLESDSRHSGKYVCEPENCNNYYTAQGSGQLTKSFNLEENKNKTIGFKLNDDINSITGISFDVESGATASCNNQLKIDFLLDGNVETGNTKITNEFCGSDLDGCYKSALQSSEGKEFGLEGMYCQRIELPESPGFRLGAWVKKESGYRNISMAIYSNETGLFQEVENGSCVLEESPSYQGKELSCEVDYLVTEKKPYYVCVYDTGGEGEYKVRGYLGIDKCGFYTSSYSIPEKINFALDIFAQPKKFAALGDLEIKSDENSYYPLSLEIQDYLEDKYGDLDCSEHDCIVPVKFISGASQSITLKNLDLSYTLISGPPTEETRFYDIEEKNAKLDMNYSKIYFDNANFSVLDEEGTPNYVLKYGSELIIRKEIEIKKGASIKSINPVKTAAGLETEFSIQTDKEITTYEWDFEGTASTKTSTNKVTHTFENTGTYPVTVSITDSSGARSSKTFNIVVSSAKEIIPELIIEKQEKLEGFLDNVSTYDSFIQEGIKKELETSEKNLKITGIESNYSSIEDSGTESQFGNLLNELLEIEIPNSIETTKEYNSLTFYPDSSNVDLDVISNVAGGNYDDASSYKEAVLGWHGSNYQTKISGKKIVGDYDFGEETILNYYKINSEEIGSGDTGYLFIKDMQGLEFYNNGSLNKVEGYYNLELGSSNSLEFYITEEIEFENLPVFVSPSLSSLSMEEIPDDVQKAGKKFNWGLYALVLLGILLIGIAVYFLMKKWYDKKYENYLFKDKNDLYNMVTYLHSSKQRGMDDENIRKNLKKAGWSGEQVNYVMRKYAGKRTGLPGFSSSEKQKQLENRRPPIRKMGPRR